MRGRLLQRKKETGGRRGAAGAEEACWVTEELRVDARTLADMTAGFKASWFQS